MAAAPFFDFGNIIAVVSNDLKYLSQWSEMAVLITKLVPSGYQESRIMFSVACGFMWSRPVHTLSKDYCKHGYQAGMKAGDTESAMWCFMHSIYFEFMAGKPLRILEENCHYYISHMKELKRTEAALLTGTLWRLILDLNRSPESSSYMTATIVDQVLSTLDVQSSDLAPYFGRAMENMLVAFRRDYVKGAELSIQRGNEFLGNFPHQPIGIWDLYLRGVCLFAAAAAAAKPGQKRRYLRHGRKLLATIQKWQSQGNLNVRHHAALLTAEDLTSRGKWDEAKQSYESAIVGASRGGFLHDAAIANERYAYSLLGGDAPRNIDSARFHFGEAKRLYVEWGSMVLANDLEEISSMLLSREAMQTLG